MRRMNWIDWDSVIKKGEIICPECGSNNIDGQPDSTMEGKPTGRYAIWCLSCCDFYATCTVAELNSLIQDETDTAGLDED